MSLPHDFTETLAKVEQYGILDENPDPIRNRLIDCKGLSSRPNSYA